MQKISELKPLARAKKTAKIVTTAFVVSGVAVAGSIVAIDDGGNNFFEDSDFLDNSVEETDKVDDVNQSQAVNSEDEMVNVLTENEDAEMYHRYGC